MTTFQAIAALLTLVALGGYINHRYLRLPATIGHMAFALVLSWTCMTLHALGLFDMAPIREAIGGIDFSAVLLHGMLAFLLFAGAMHLRFKDLREVGLPVAVLATAGVVLATAIIGALTWQGARLAGFDLPFIYALLFGALISPTDPIAVLAILKEAGMSKKLYTKIGGESLFNDGVGIVVFLTILGVATGAQAATAADILALLAQEALGGVALGLALGWAAYGLLSTIDDYRTEVVITLALAAGGYALAELVHFSAPLCMVVAGLFVGNKGRQGMSDLTREKVDGFWELVDEAMNAVLFMLVGFEIVIIAMTFAHVLLGVLAIAAVLAGRFISVGLPVALMSLKVTFEKGTVPILVWGGLRGGLSIAMALSLPEGPEKNIILPVTYIVVLFSILVQGLSFRRFLKWISR